MVEEIYIIQLNYLRISVCLNSTVIHSVLLFWDGEKIAVGRQTAGLVSVDLELGK